MIIWAKGSLLMNTYVSSLLKNPARRVDQRSNQHNKVDTLGLTPSRSALNRCLSRGLATLALCQLSLGCTGQEPDQQDHPDDDASGIGSKESNSEDSNQDSKSKTKSPESNDDSKSEGTSEPSTESESGCKEPKRIVCDKDSEDPLHAFGINCPKDATQISAEFSGAVTARGVFEKLGNTEAFHPREGTRYLVLGTGNVAEMHSETPASDIDLLPTYCSDDLQTDWDRKTSLPSPIVPNRVGDKDCWDLPSLIGTGDCSNTIQAQWDATSGRRHRANDLQELRIKAKVPKWAHSLTYDFAFLTTEYPGYYKNDFNDIFIAWLQSKTWTGNISFDKKGSPISLNAGFLDYKDARNGSFKDPECAKGCTAVELEGSCMKGHAATRWLTTKVGVTPGEEIELVFAVVDLGDSMMDSYVFLDNFRWSCEEQETPKTDPPPPV